MSRVLTSAAGEYSKTEKAVVRKVTKVFVQSHASAVPGIHRPVRRQMKQVSFRRGRYQEAVFLLNDNSDDNSDLNGTIRRILQKSNE